MVVNDGATSLGVAGSYFVAIKSTPLDEADSWRRTELKELYADGARAWTKCYLNLELSIFA